MKQTSRIIASTGIWLGLVITAAHAFCNEELEYLFDDCSPYNNSRYFGGTVCGSDGGTYPNRLYVRCLSHQNPASYRELRVSYKGPCTTRGQKCPYSPLYKPICATDKKTYPNLEALICKVTLNSTELGVLNEEECEWDKPDPCNWELWVSNPVCANNGLTYPNIAQLRCLQNDKPDLRVLHEGGCSPHEALSLAAKTTSKACWLAKNRYEWNPVCGTDNVTYPNPFVLLCHQPYVKVQFQGECDSPMHLICLRIKEEKVLDHDKMMCGSDGITYMSEDHLYCASSKDKYLWPQHKGHCTSADDPCQQRSLSLLDVSTYPICATDGNTYVSPSAIWCIQRNHDPCLKFLHDGPCFPTDNHLPY